MIGSNSLSTNPQYLSALKNDKMMPFVKTIKITESGSVNFDLKSKENIYRIAVHNMSNEANDKTGAISLSFNNNSVSVPLFGSVEHSYVTFDTSTIKNSSSSNLKVIIDSTKITSFPIIVELFCKLED